MKFIHISFCATKNYKCNDKRKKDKMTNIDLQNTTQKTKDRQNEPH
jgi:hypothetical protein